jgi:apolipoprotein D and lipocalin family protein
MFTRLALAAAAALVLCAPTQAAPETAQKIEFAKMMGRWYEVARVPNALQDGCQAGASEWRPSAGGFAVLQTCRKGSPDGPLAQWKAKATLADPSSNIIKMSFYGGVVSQKYKVLDHRPDQGWLILSTTNGKYLWLFSQKPTLPAPVRAQAITRIRQLGFDPGRLEFPAPARS